MEDTQLLTVPAIEDHYGVSRFRLYKIIADGELPSIRIGAKRIYVRREDWELYLQNAKKK